MDSMLIMSGLQSLIYGSRTHPNDFNEQFSTTIIQFGRHNYMDLLTFHMKNAAIDSCEYV